MPTEHRKIEELPCPKFVLRLFLLPAHPVPDDGDVFHSCVSCTIGFGRTNAEMVVEGVSVSLVPCSSPCQNISGFTLAAGSDVLPTLSVFSDLRNLRRMLPLPNGRNQHGWRTGLRTAMKTGFAQKQLGTFQTNPQFGLYLAHMMAHPSAQVSFVLSCLVFFFLSFFPSLRLFSAAVSLCPRFVSCDRGEGAFDILAAVLLPGGA